MAVYDAECQTCWNLYEYRVPIADREQVPACPLCNGAGKRTILAAPQGFVTGKFDAFKSPVDGSVIHCVRDLKEHNKRNGVVQLQEGYSEAKVIRGDFGQKAPTNNVKEVADDIQEAIHDVTHGYKPIVEVQDDD